MVKFADDSYIIILSSNVESRQREVEHAEQWAVKNNLRVNVAKYMEVVFFDKRSRKFGKITPPPPLPGIKRVNTVKILGVTLSDDLSVEDHVHAVISSAAGLYTRYVYCAVTAWTMLPYSRCFERSSFQSCSTLRVRGGDFRPWPIDRE